MLPLLLLNKVIAYGIQEKRERISNWSQIRVANLLRQKSSNTLTGLIPILSV
jgi:hypothetical protein